MKLKSFINITEIPYIFNRKIILLLIPNRSETGIKPKTVIFKGMKSKTDRNTVGMQISCSGTQQNISRNINFNLLLQYRLQVLY